MKKRAIILPADPLSDGFLSREDFSLSKRVGLALVECAKSCKIEFNKHHLATVYLNSEYGLSNFHFSSGISFDYNQENINNLLNDHPELTEVINFYHDKLSCYMDMKNIHKNDVGKNLTESTANWGGGWGGHSNPDFARFVNKGTTGIRKKINKYRRKNPEKSEFYDGCEYVLSAFEILGQRFQKLAEKKYNETTDPEEKKRYKTAIQTFKRAPKYPCKDFESACQIMWMTFTFDGIDSPGRFDQYMYRCYKNTHNHDEIMNSLERIWESFHDTRAWNLCISGSDENWNDMTNELSYDILTVAQKYKYQTPNLTMRIHRNTPEKLWQAAADTIATGIGMPVLYNDEVVCKALEKVGIPPKDSHLYCMNGCNQIDIMAKSHMGLEDGEVSFGKVLELTLHNGTDVMTGKEISLKTGNLRFIRSFDELKVAFYQQLDYVTFHACNLANNAQHMRATFEPNPFRSCLIDGCIEKGIDYRNGGPLYGHGQILAEGIADTGDSLYAIKKLVFEDKKYTMTELLNALDCNFEGYEVLRRDFMNCPKFGNDIPEVDKITTDIFNHFSEFLKTQHTYRGGVYMSGCSPFSRASYYGMNVAALPNGKLKGDPMYADCICAVPGCDEKGPTALINSTLRYDQYEIGSGFVFQCKIDKKLFDSEVGREAYINVAKTYFAHGGQQFTASVLSQEELLDAKKHPEKHKDLIVRVGGYSDYFVNLSEELQDNVIARTYLL